MRPHQHDRILEALHEAGPLTDTELAAIVDDHPVTVERQCAELLRSGRIRRCTGGMYTLDEDGWQPRSASD